MMKSVSVWECWWFRLNSSQKCWIFTPHVCVTNNYCIVMWVLLKMIWYVWKSVDHSIPGNLKIWNASQTWFVLIQMKLLLLLMLKEPFIALFVGELLMCVFWFAFWLILCALNRWTYWLCSTWFNWSKTFPVKLISSLYALNLVQVEFAQHLAILLMFALLSAAHKAGSWVLLSMHEDNWHKSYFDDLFADSFNMQCVLIALIIVSKLEMSLIDHTRCW